MLIKNLHLKNFRNYSDYKFGFSPEVTVIVGPNASGKSNILEAIGLLASGKSARSRYDKEFVRQGCDLGSVRSDITSIQSGKTELQIFIQSSSPNTNISRKTFKVNSIKRGLRNFVGNLHVVSFAPEDLNTVSGSPSMRRSYIDCVLSQLSVGTDSYIGILSEYTKVRRQRNKVLEAICGGFGNIGELEFWNGRLVLLGVKIQSLRSKFFEDINQLIPVVETTLDGSMGSLELSYVPSALTQERLESFYSREVGAKQTLIGPHRDDFLFKKGGRDLAIFGSRGEQRLGILVSKIAQLEYMSAQVGERPVLVLDDVFSELDAEHRQQVLGLVSSQQTIMATTDLSMVGELGNEANIINLFL